MYIFLFGVCLILAGGLASIFADEERKGFVFMLFFSAGSFLTLILSLLSLLFSYHFQTTFSFGFPSEIISLEFDPLSSFFTSIIIAVGYLGVLYGVSYLKSYNNQSAGLTSHYIFIAIFFSALVMLPIIRNAFFFLVVWEIMSLSSFFLILFERKKKEVLSAAINYLITMHISVILLIIGFSILTTLSGSFDFSSFRSILGGNRYFSDTIFAIFFIAFGIKAGFVPLHFWLPKAHPAAPSHISGIMSGLMIKIGIYGILRIILLIQKPTTEMAYFVLIISALSALYGILNAIAQQDLKKILAYSSIENVGIIGIGIGLGMLGLAYNNTLVAFLGFAGGIMHILNHSIFKELLFLGSGSIYSKTHTKEIEKLGGLAKKMPHTAVMYLIGSLAITGLPPFNGFISEFLIYFGFIASFKIHNINILIVSILMIGVLALVGTMALLCFTRVFSIVFQGVPRSEEAKKIKGDVSVSMLIPKIALCSFIFIIGILPNLAFFLIYRVSNLFMPPYQSGDAEFFTFKLLNSISLFIIIFIAIILIVICIRALLLRNKKIAFYKTWDCGYQAGNERMQYTAHSFAQPFLDLLKGVFKNNDSANLPKTLFPSIGYYRVKIFDSLESYFVTPLINNIELFLKKFIWIQNGSTQIYILYGFVFLLLALTGLFILY